MTNRVFRFREFELDCGRYELRRKDRAIKLEKMPMELLILLATRKGDLVTRQEMAEHLWGSNVFVDSEHGINTAIRKLRQALRDDSDKPRFVETVTGKGYRFIAETILHEYPATQIPREPGATQNRSSLHELPFPAGIENTHVDLLEQNGSHELTTEAQLNGNHDETARVSSTAFAPSDEVDGAERPAPTPAKASSPRKPVSLLWSGAAVLIAGLGALIWYLHRPIPPPTISDYVKLTHDGKKRILVATDGIRLYLNEVQPRLPVQMGIADGALSPIPLKITNPTLIDVSADGSRFLVQSLDDGALWSAGATGGSPRLLTKTDFDCVASSPDGKWLAYSTSAGDVYRVKSDWTESLKLVSSEKGMPKPASDLVWSPDSSTLRFTRNHKLWEVSSQGSNLRQLLPNWTASPYTCCGHWTADGKFFLFLSGDTQLGSAPFAPGDQLWALDERHSLLRSQASRTVQLTSGPTRWGAPIPSKNGKTIFARGAIVRGELVRYDSKSKEFRPFLGGISAEFLSFSNDGKSVAYVTFPEGILWKANRDGSDPLQLTDPPMYPKVARFSPDGSKILFTDSPPPNSRAVTYVVSSTGGKPEPLLPDEKGTVNDAGWSPDGHRVVFTSGDGTETPALPAFLRILDLTSRKISTLPGSNDMWSPRWSPDGRNVAAFSNAGALKIFDFKTGIWSTLTDHAGDFPTFSQDSRWIYFMRYSRHAGNDAGVFRISTSGGKAEKIADAHGFKTTGWFGGWFGLDPTDAPLSLRDAGTENIYALKLETK